MHRILGRTAALAILVWAASAAAADEPRQVGEFAVTVKDDRVSIAAKDASSNAILQDLGRKAGFDVAVMAADDRQVTLDLRDVSFEAAVQRLSRNYAVLFARTEGVGYRVVKVTSGGAGGQGLEAALTAAQVIEEIRRKNSAVESYRADIVEFSQGQLAGRRVSLLKGEGSRFRLEMDLPEGGKYIMLSDGGKILVWMPHFDAVWRSDLRRVEEELGMEAVRNLDRDWRPPWVSGADDTRADSLRYLGVEEIDGRRAYVLEGRTRMPRGTHAAGTSYSQRVWINTRTGFPERAVFYDKQGTEMRSQRFTNVVTNPTWEGDAFRLDVPAGVPTVDETRWHIDMIRQTRMIQARAEESLAE